MGIVYRAVDIKLDREVALKVLPPELVADPERKRRFVQGAKAAAALHHPHIATIFAVDEDEGPTFIAMELIRGFSASTVWESAAHDSHEGSTSTPELIMLPNVGEGARRAHGSGLARSHRSSGALAHEAAVPLELPLNLLDGPGSFFERAQ